MRTVLAVLIAGVLICGAIVLPLLARSDDKAAGRMGSANGQVGPVDTKDLAAVQKFEVPSIQHTPETVDYPQSPPVGGNHDGAWLECGVYDEQVREENAVHALEHGTVWITYDSSLSDSDVAKLAELLPDEGILSPNEGQSAPAIITVWGTQLRLTGAGDIRIQLFLDAYGQGETAPEPMASCHGGVQRLESEDGSAA
nr:DUF3105 domain-containing protein [Nocardioides daedukensis]